MGLLRLVSSSLFFESSISIEILIYSRNTRLRRNFPRPSGEPRLQHPFGIERKKNKLGYRGCPTFGAPRAPHPGRWLTLPSVAIQKNWVTCGAPNCFKNLTRAMRIPNMCLVLKLDNGKVVSFPLSESHSHPVAY